jgi:ABC-2 type transport system permease protein
MQLSVFLLLPILILSGAFGPLSQLPRSVQLLSSVFPLTHYCHAFRLINIYNADPALILGDLLVLLLGSILLLAASTQLLKQV